MFLENLLLALKSLWANKMRSFLTTLGIVIGVSAVIGVVSIVQGFSQVISTEIANLGSNSVIVQPNRPPGKEGEKLSRIELTWDDGQALVRNLATLEAAAPILQRFEQVKFGDESTQYPILGTIPIFQDLRNYYVQDGRFFSAIDERERLQVCVLGHGVLKDLKLPDNPIGSELRIAGSAYRIIGVMEPKGQLLGQDFDKFVMIPFGTAVGIYGDDAAKQVGLLLHVRSADLVERATNDIEDFLRIRHHLREGQPNDFEIVSQTQIQKGVGEISNSVTTSSLHRLDRAARRRDRIKNIMLVSVTKDARDRRAQGRRRPAREHPHPVHHRGGDVALTGGIVGILLGMGSACCREGDPELAALASRSGRSSCRSAPPPPSVSSSGSTPPRAAPLDPSSRCAE
jgi:putative ABC transport system permease protein